MAFSSVIIKKHSSKEPYHLQALKKTFDRGFPENDFAQRIMLAASLHGLYQGCSWWHLEMET